MKNLKWNEVSLNSTNSLGENNMENLELNDEVKNEAARIKKEKGCQSVFVDITYSQPRYFPVYNDAQKKFIKSIFEDRYYSRIDDLILETLETKMDDLDGLERYYENCIDFLD